MTAAFIETTVLVDYLLKKDGSQNRAAAAFANHDGQIIPQFAWKELKRSPLKNFVWAHNKLASTKSFLESMSALQRMSRSPQRYLTATAMQALHTAFANLFNNLEALKKVHQEKANPDRLYADALRLELKLVINRAWKVRGQLFGGPFHKLSCYPDAPVREHAGLLDLKPRDCSAGQECCLKPALVSRPRDLSTIRNALKSITDRKEVALRGKVLRQLEKHSSSLMGKECRAFGDGYFVLFCPNNGVVITTNRRDIEPMANALVWLSKFLGSLEYIKLHTGDNSSKFPISSMGRTKTLEF